jgi:hypothetical protein
LPGIGHFGITDRLGITYTYDYDVTYASSRYEHRFHRHRMRR